MIKIVQTDQRRFWTATRIVLFLAIAKLLFHLVTFRGYGIFRDELYYLACSRHLAFGYVEFPPMIAVLTRAATSVLGESLFAVRLLPMLGGAALVVLAAMIARELGGGRFSQALARVSVIAAPGWLAIDHTLQTNAFDPLFWGGCAWLAIRALKTGNSRHWLWFGAVAGLGLLNKHAMLFFGFGIFGGLLLTPARKLIRERNLWLGGLIAALLFLPNVIWEIRLGWPTLEFLRNAVRYKNAVVTPLQFLGGQLELTGAAALVWIAGLLFYFFGARGKPYRALGWAYVIVLTTIFAFGGKAYYVLPAYPMLLGAGAVEWEQFIERRAWNWLKPALPALMLAFTAVIAPLAVPLLPVETFIRYADALGIHPQAEERHATTRLPQYYADMLGWRNMAEQVALVFHHLSPEEQAHAAIYGQNYGEAAAIDYYAPRLGIPHAISGHNNYFLWGPGNRDPSVLIVIGGNPDNARKLYDDVRAAGTITYPDVMPYENHLTIWVCRRPKISLRLFWPKLKRYI
jgi:hypothetical protein